MSRQPAARPAAAPAGRIARRFESLAEAGRGGLITFITAGDPNPEVSFEILSGLPDAGADVIEIGMPFSDPMADGPAIQAAGQRALKAGMTLARTLQMVERFRLDNVTTPIVLMGYYNPIYRYGVDRFVADAGRIGVDGLIIVDLPPEEDTELCHPALAAGLNWIRLVTPTTTDERLRVVLANASGFVYYVAIAGITGTRSASEAAIAAAVERIRGHTNLPIAVGFGVRTPEQAARTARAANAAVVGSALIDTLSARLNTDGTAQPGLVTAVLDCVRQLAAAIRD